MIYFHCLKTGSKGNCYLLYSGSETLIIECGLKQKDILYNIKDFHSVVGAILSHNHSDHNALNGKQRTSDLFKQSGITVLSPENTQCNKKYKLGNFEIIPIKATHNVTCYSYFIKIENKIILFATDTITLPMSNIKIDYALVECNYCNELCEKARNENYELGEHINKIEQNHCGLNTVSNWINKLSTKPQKVFLIHKSNSGYFSQEMATTTLKQYCNNIFVCDNNNKYILEE